METMHSKFVRLQTALLMLALLFTVLVPVPTYAAGSAEGTANSVAISDPDTFNAWEYTQGYNNSTTGRIWGDKTVEENKITFSGDLTGQAPIAVPTDKGADFLVALSALSSYASTTTTDTQPLDIVMVLDASGSMNDPMGNNDGTTRIRALRTAVNNFIANLFNRTILLFLGGMSLLVAGIIYFFNTLSRDQLDIYSTTSVSYTHLFLFIIEKL